MANAPKTNPDMLEPIKTLSAAMVTNPALGPQAQHFWQAQDKMLQEAEKFSSAWFKRRHEATQSALQASQEIASESTSDPASALKAMTEWQAKSMDRMAADARDCMDMMTRCAGLAVGNEAQALEETADTARKAAKGSKSDPV